MFVTSEQQHQHFIEDQPAHNSLNNQIELNALNHNELPTTSGISSSSYTKSAFSKANANGTCIK